MNSTSSITSGHVRQRIPILEGSSLVHALALTAIVAALFVFGPPSDDAFSWPDAPRHALNGAFVLDLVKNHPWHNAVNFAFNYYTKYPALTILFYPPFFYVVLAMFYAVFGVSQHSALLAGFGFYVALALGTYRLARFWLPATAAFGAALILASSPETAYWGRQVMLDVPSLALLVWSGVYFMRHLEEKRAVWLYAAVFLLILAMYTKISAGFLGIVFLLLLTVRHGPALLRDRNSYFVAALAVLALVPLVVLTLRFGQENLHSVAGIADSRTSRASVAGWIWYALRLPSQLGAPALVAAVIGIVVAVFRKRRLNALLFPLLWLAIGYLFFSAIDLKVARFTVVFLPPLAILASFGIVTVLTSRPLLANLLVVGLGLFTLALTFVTRPVQYVEGYGTVADFIAGAAPKDSNIAFSGYRDGSFIFAMRTHEERRDLSTIRVDKLLLNIAVRRGLGVQDKGYNAAQIGQMLDRLGVRLVVAQPGFWADLGSMHEFGKLLQSRQFQPLRRFTMKTNYNSQEKELIVYRNLDRIAPGPVELNTEIPMIGRSIGGVLGHGN